MSASPSQRILIDNLRAALESEAGSKSVGMLETHISCVLLAGDHAFKIKKAVDLGFLDFRSLAQRRYFCEREWKLNRRFSPHIYEDVVPITGSPEKPLLGGSGEPIEFAVKMRQFPQACRADNMLRKGIFDIGDADALAAKLAACHQYAAHEPAGLTNGSRRAMATQVAEAASNLLRLAKKSKDYEEAKWLSAWCVNEGDRLKGAMERRLADGHVRDCHGDLHLANIVVLDGESCFFDCIEFDDALRYIDVMSDLAFPVMDLQAHGRADLAYRLLNAYLELSGDYAGLEVLRLYAVYRALIRAQVALLPRDRSRNKIPVDDTPSCRHYLDVAMSWAKPQKHFLMLMHGFSGSGKSTVSQQILQVCGAIRLRSDVERKRLLRHADHITAGSELAAKAYSPEFTLMTYLRLLHLTQELLDAGYRVVVDACFLHHDQRQPFHKLATSRHIPFEIVDVHAEENVLRERIRKRVTDGDDASDADLSVLAQQLKNQEPFSVEEFPAVCGYESVARPAKGRSSETVSAFMQTLFQRLVN